MAQTLHPLSASTESDGLEKLVLAQTLHLFWASAASDGDFMYKCSNRLHPIKKIAVSDGDFRQERPNRLHPKNGIVVSDGDFRQKRSIWLHPKKKKVVSDGAARHKQQKQKRGNCRTDTSFHNHLASGATRPSQIQSSISIVTGSSKVSLPPTVPAYLPCLLAIFTVIVPPGCSKL